MYSVRARCFQWPLVGMGVCERESLYVCFRSMYGGKRHYFDRPTACMCVCVYLRVYERERVGHVYFWECVFVRERKRARGKYV